MKPQFTAKITDMKQIERRRSGNTSKDYREYRQDLRIYVSVKDPKELLPSVDNYSDILNNKAIRETAVIEALRLLGLSEDHNARYSRTAGCSCGCSPAYIVCDFYTRIPSDVFVTVEVTNENPRNLIRLFSGERIDFRGPGWYRLSKVAARVLWTKVETMDHANKTPMTYVELADTTIA